MQEKSDLVFHYSTQADKFFIKHKDIEKKFVKGIIDYLDGRNVDIKAIKGLHRFSRMRIGKYRVIFSVIKDKITVVDVLLADSRGDIYKRMRSKK